VANKGIVRERQVRQHLEAEGWWVCRAAGSLGDADLIALKAGHTPRLIEVKANKDGGPYKGFVPKDREELSIAAAKAGARAELCYWPPRFPIRFIGEDEWPR
jgi:Holliday junction resolvase